MSDSRIRDLPVNNTPSRSDNTNTLSDKDYKTSLGSIADLAIIPSTQIIPSILVPTAGSYISSISDVRKNIYMDSTSADCSFTIPANVLPTTNDPIWITKIDSTPNVVTVKAPQEFVRLSRQWDTVKLRFSVSAQKWFVEEAFAGVEQRSKNIYSPPPIKMLPVIDRRGIQGAGSVQTNCAVNSYKMRIPFKSPQDTWINGFVVVLPGWFLAGQSAQGPDEQLPLYNWTWGAEIENSSGVRTPVTWRGNSTITVPPGWENYYSDPCVLTDRVAADDVWYLVLYALAEFKAPIISVSCTAGVLTVNGITDPGNNLNLAGTTNLSVNTIPGGGTGYGLTLTVSGGQLISAVPIQGTGKSNLTNSTSTTFQGGVKVQTSFRTVSSVNGSSDGNTVGQNLTNDIHTFSFSYSDHQIPMPIAVGCVQYKSGVKSIQYGPADSYIYGNSDSNTTADSGGRCGYYNKEIVNKHGGLWLASGGCSVWGELTSPKHMQRELSKAFYITDAYINLCRNDLYQSTVYQGLDRLIDMSRDLWQEFMDRGIRVRTTTIGPKTVTNTITIANPEMEADRLAWNSLIRNSYKFLGLAGYVDQALHTEDQGNPGTWRQDLGGAASTDFTHPSPLCITQMVTEKTVDPDTNIAPSIESGIITRINGKIGDTVTLTATDVGAASTAALALKLDADNGLFGAASLTAVGTTQSGAALIAHSFTRVLTSSGQQAVILPIAVPGARYVVYPSVSATNTVLVYPASGEQIGNGGANVAVGMSVTTSFAQPWVFECIVSGNWEVLLGARAYSSIANALAAAGSAGTSGQFARGDHIHPDQTSAGTLAATGTSQGTAAALTNIYTKVSTSTNNAGVILPAATPGKRFRVAADQASTVTISVYPASGETISNGTANVSATLTTNLTTSPLSMEFFCVVAGNWESSLSFRTSGGVPLGFTASGATGGQLTAVRYDHQHPFQADTAVKAAAGTTQGTATPITTVMTRVSTSNASNIGVILPSAVLGAIYIVQMDPAATIAGKIYPASGQGINLISTNGAYVLDVDAVVGGTGHCALFVCTQTNIWSVLRGVRLSDVLPVALAAVASIGVSPLAARADHVHSTDVDSADLAAAGATQGTATAMTTTLATIATSSVGVTDGIILPAATVGKQRIVINRSGAVAKVYPASGEAFRSFSANSNLALAGNIATSIGMLICWCAVAGTWEWLRLPINTYGGATSGIKNLAATANVGIGNDAAKSDHIHASDHEVGNVTAAGLIQGSATAITATITNVTPPDASNTGVILPAATVGRWRRVVNLSLSQAMKVYPASGESIANGTVNVGLVVAATGGGTKIVLDFFCTVAGTWELAYFTRANNSASTVLGDLATATAGVSDLMARGDHRHLSDEEVTAISGAGTTQGGATPITSTWSAVTSTSGQIAVLLPAATVGKRRRITNVGGLNISIFPASGETIIGQSANSSLNLTSISNDVFSVDLICVVAGNWSLFRHARLTTSTPVKLAATASFGATEHVARSDHIHASDVEVGAIAGAGTTQGTATAITTTTVAATPAASNDGIILPAATLGRTRKIFNMSATVALKVYPAVGETINDGGGVNAATTINFSAAGARKTPIEFICLVAGTWDIFAGN